jgi:DNA-binding MarR family transcriptional regulator
MANNIIRNWMLTNIRLKKLKSVFPVDCDLRMNELWALRKIEQATHASGSGIGNTEIQEDLQITKSAVSQMLDSLFEKGYIDRTLDASDRRRMCVTITPAGTQVLKRMSAYANLLAEKVTAKMGEEKIQHMFDLLNEFIDTSLDVEKETPYSIPSQKNTPDGNSNHS